MKRNFRFYFALFFARGTALVLKLIGRKGTSMPGSWAIILCPDFLNRMPRPKTVIGITGTNGKTTVSNIVEDVLEDCGYKFMCNRMGTNVATGVASTLIANSYFFGNPKFDLAVFELDERSTPHIFPYIQPDILLCTNIFRDSYKRNAHTEFIMDILNQNVPDSTRLILNADDLLCSSIKPDNERVYFGITQMLGESNSVKNIVRDINVCPKCGGKLSWQFVRYHHIGRATCTKCDFTSPTPNYQINEINPQESLMHVRMKEEEVDFPLINSNMINIYNSLSAIALLAEIGVSSEYIVKSMKGMRVAESRYQEKVVCGKNVILHLAKGQNPVACSRAFENAKMYAGKKTVILLLEDWFDSVRSVENPSWYYDTDFEFLNDDSITQIIACGVRHWDTYVRLLIAGIPESKLMHMEDVPGLEKGVNPEQFDTVFILHDLCAGTIVMANDAKELVCQKIEKELGEG